MRTLQRPAAHDSKWDDSLTAFWEARQFAGKTVGRFKDKPPLVRYDREDPDAIGW